MSKYEIWSVDKAGKCSCHLMCSPEKIDETLDELKNKYPDIPTWVFGLHIHVRKAGG